jgi:hypothetical protein
MKKLIIVLSVLIIAGCIVTSCRSLTESGASPLTTPTDGVTATTSEATPGSMPAADMTPVGGTEAAFGQALDFGGLVIRVDTPFEDSGATPTPGNRAWAALVTIQNNRSADAMYNPLDFHFVDAASNIFEAIGASNLQMMSTGILPPGGQAQAYIVMQLPSDTPPVQIRYEPYIPSDEKWVGIWR